MCDDETAFEPLSDDQVRFLTALEANEVRAVVIGGYAARVHGVREGSSLRSVQDLDVVVDVGRGTLDRFGSALSSLTVSRLDDVIAGFRDQPKFKWRWQEGYHDHFVDVLSSIDVGGFQELWDAGQTIDHEGLDIRVIGRDHFIGTKRKALADPNRGSKIAQDRKDLEALLSK